MLRARHFSCRQCDHTITMTSNAFVILVIMWSALGQGHRTHLHVLDVRKSGDDGLSLVFAQNKNKLLHVDRLITQLHDCIVGHLRVAIHIASGAQ